MCITLSLNGQTPPPSESPHQSVEQDAPSPLAFSDSEPSWLLELLEVIQGIIESSGRVNFQRVLTSRISAEADL